MEEIWQVFSGIQSWDCGICGRKAVILRVYTQLEEWETQVVWSINRNCFTVFRVQLITRNVGIVEEFM